MAFYFKNNEFKRTERKEKRFEVRGLNMWVSVAVGKEMEDIVKRVARMKGWT